MVARVAEAVAPAPRDGPLSLYVHVPFCRTKCPYCDFNTYAGIEGLIPSYVEAISTEIDRWGRLLGRPQVATVFLGGGTPSYLPPDELAALVGAWQGACDIAEDAEVTLEANPDDVTQSGIERFLRLGINRLSIGVQSLDDRLLEGLGRRHDAAQALAAYRDARNAGMGNVSIDLMFGLPGQVFATWQDTLERAIDLETDHMSLYALSVEPGTPLAADVAAGRVSEADPDLAADMYELARELLGAAGYGHYEVSNWAKPGRASRHNLTYWNSGPYLGVGPGAHSSLGGIRFANMKSPRGYVARMELAAPDECADNAVEAMRRAGPVEEVEPESVELEMSDTMMLGLRLDGGVSVGRFVKRFDADPRDVYSRTIESLAARKLLEVGDDAIRVPHNAWIVGNEVFSSFAGAPETRLDRTLAAG